VYVAASCPWDLGRGTRGVARPPALQTFFHARKNIFQTFFDMMDSIYRAWHNFGKIFSGGPQAQGQWSHKAMTCACGMCVHCTFTVGTCQLCPGMSEGGSKHSDFCDKRVQYCKNALLRFQRSKNEISKRIFRFQSAKSNFQVPLKSRVRSPAYNNMTKP